jgi:NAD(P)-dependent dehydrogenase (short-subunit alcohol dehydrogenase family)
MMRRLANETATSVVHVDVVCPGIIETPMVDRRLIRTPDHVPVRKAATAAMLAAMALSLRPSLAAGGTGAHG